MHMFFHSAFYAGWDAWDEAVRLISWFGVPLLIYVLLPLTALAAVSGGVRVFKAALYLTMLLAAPTALYWDNIAMQLVWFHRHFSSAPPAAPALPDGAGHFIATADPDLNRW